MKRLIIITTLTILFGLSSFAQDLIITSTGDSINCKITKEKGDFTYFTFVKEKEVRNTLLPKSQIREYKKGYFAQSEIPVDYKIAAQNYERFRFSVNGGYSYRFAKISETIPNDYQNYMKGLKSGSHISIDASYFINETIGLGMKYSKYFSKGDFGTINADYNGDGIIDSGQMNDNISISFLGPMFTTNMPSRNKKNALYSSLAIGYLSYKDDGKYIEPLLLEGSTVGFVGDLGYQIEIARNMSIAFTLSYTLGTLTKIESTGNGYSNTIELDKDSYENLGRIDFSIGLVFHK